MFSFPRLPGAFFLAAASFWDGVPGTPTGKCRHLFGFGGGKPTFRKARAACQSVW